MSLAKPIHELAEADLQELISNGVTERQNIDYKEALTGTNDDAKREFLADISSFANTAGGHLVYGISEAAGIPTGLPGVVIPDFDAEKLRLENLMRDGMSPRISGIEISERILLSAGTSAFVIRVPRSLASPHMVSFKGLSKFFGRNSAGKYQLDVGQLRSAFAFSASLAEKLRDFRADRIMKIAAGLTPVKLIARPTVVLHMVPLSAFETGQKLTATELTNTIKPGEAFPIYSDNAFAFKVNFDGLVYFATFGDGQSTSYLQVFKNGTVESVSSELMYGSTVIHGARLEGHLVRKSVPSYLKSLQKLQVPPPVFVGLSLIGVANHTMEAAKPSPFGQPQPLGSDMLILPEVVFEAYDADVASTLKPAFDSLWNAAGKTESPFYDGGQWKGMTKFNPNNSPW
jgi:Putative DNA-binding domain